MTRPYPYTIGSYQVAIQKKPGLETFARLSRRRWKFRNLGTLVRRNMNGKPVLSVHAAGAACDLGYGSSVKERQKAVEACRWFVEHNHRLGVVAIHDYASAGAPRAWRCDRGEWRTFTDGELGPGGKWLHVEIDPKQAGMSETEYEAIWRSLPKP